MPTDIHKTTQHDDERKPPTAHSLEDAVNSDNSLEGYAAMNDSDRDEVAKIAYDFYVQRGYQHGGHEEDWARAEQEVRNRMAQRGKREPAKGSHTLAASGD